ncbi:toll/interleukin-1 receptor domain-containing protein, partial [Streptomyces nigra]
MRQEASAVSDLDSQIPYWNSAATTKTCTHPLHSPRLAGIGKHGGTRYVSDFLLQEDERNRARYARGSSHFDDYGGFETEDGGVFRHHSRSWFFSLLRDFTTVARRDITVNTMSGHEARGYRHWAASLSPAPTTERGLTPTGVVMTESGGRPWLFVSHAGADLAWAEWVAWQLRDAGYDVELDSWHWGAGDNVIVRMDEALAQRRMVALFSAAYFDRRRWTTEEWTAVIAGRDGLVPVRLDDSAAPPMLRALKAPALCGMGEEAARQALLAAVAGPVGAPEVLSSWRPAPPWTSAN